MTGSSLRDGYLKFSDLAPSVRLPRGFTGIMIGRYKDSDMQCSRLCSTHALDWDTSGLIRFLKVRTDLCFPTPNRSVFPFLFLNHACSCSYRAIVGPQRISRASHLIEVTCHSCPSSSKQRVCKLKATQTLNPDLCGCDDVQIADAQKTIDFVSRADQRFRANEARNSALKQKLEHEMQEHDDVLVVPVLESYRNLPLKLLHFFDWYVALLFLLLHLRSP